MDEFAVSILGFILKKKEIGYLPFPTVKDACIKGFILLNDEPLLIQAYWVLILDNSKVKLLFHVHGAGPPTCIDEVEMCNPSALDDLDKMLTRIQLGMRPNEKREGF